MFRVLKPGGRLVICEFSHAAGGVRAGRLRRVPALRDAAARAALELERHGLRLPQRVDQRVARPAHARQWIRGAGSRDVAWRNLTVGVVALHRGRKPAATPVESAPPTRRVARPRPLVTRRPRPPRRARLDRAAGRRLPDRLDRESEPPGRPSRLGARSPTWAWARASSPQPPTRRSPGRSTTASSGSRRACSTRCGSPTPSRTSRRRYLLEAGGKRVRPMLTLLTAQLGDGHHRRRHHRRRRPSRSPTSPRCTTTTSWTSADRRRGVPTRADRVGQLGRDPHRRPAVRPRQPAHGEPRRAGASRMQADTFERLVPRPAARDRRPARRRGPDRALHPGARRQDRLAHRGRRAVGRRSSRTPTRGVPRAGRSSSARRIGVAFQLIDDVIDLSPQLEETGKVARHRPARRRRHAAAAATCAELAETDAGVRRPAAPHRARRRRADRTTTGRRRRLRGAPSPSCATTRSRAIRSPRRTAGPRGGRGARAAARGPREEGAHAIRRDRSSSAPS